MILEPARTSEWTKMTKKMNRSDKSCNERLIDKVVGLWNPDTARKAFQVEVECLTFCPVSIIRDRWSGGNEHQSHVTCKALPLTLIFQTTPVLLMNVQCLQDGCDSTLAGNAGADVWAGVPKKDFGTHSHGLGNRIEVVTTLEV